MKQKILLNDTFTGTNATALTAHRPDKLYIPAAAWATLATHTIPQIQSNRASATADATNNSAYIDVGRIHGQIEANIRAGTTSGETNWIKILFRLLDVNNHWFVQVGETASASFNLLIGQTVGGSSTTLATRTCTFADATDYKIVVRYSGNLVYVTYNDGAADLQYHVGVANRQNVQTSKWFAPGTYVGFWEYIAATSTTYPLVADFKVLG